MNDLGRYIFKLKLNSYSKIVMECFFVILTIVAAIVLSNHFDILVKKLSFLSPNIEFGIFALIFFITVFSHGVFTQKYIYDSEVVFLRSLGFANWKICMLYVFNLRYHFYFQMVLIFACFSSISIEMITVFVLLYGLFILVFTLTMRKAFIPDRFKGITRKRRILKTGKNKLLALIKNDLNIAGKIIEIKLFVMIYVLYNVFFLNSDYLSFNIVSWFYIFLVSLTSEKFFIRNKELKNLYSVLGIEFKQFYISKLATLCVIALVPVMFFLSIKTVWGVISFKFWLLTVMLNILISLSFINYWVSIFTRFWERSNAFLITIFAFSMFIPPLIYIVPVALHKRSYKKWGGGF